MGVKPIRASCEARSRAPRYFIETEKATALQRQELYGQVVRFSWLPG